MGYNYKCSIFCTFLFLFFVPSHLIFTRHFSSLVSKGEMRVFIRVEGDEGTGEVTVDVEIGHDIGDEIPVPERP